MATLQKQHEKKKKGHTFYKVVPERSQCALNGHGILDGDQDIFNRLQVNYQPG